MVNKYTRYFKDLQKHQEIYKNNVQDAWKLRTLIAFHYLDRDPQEYEINVQFVRTYRPDKAPKDQDYIIYQSMDDFYKDYDLYPYKDINPLILDVVDTSDREATLWEEID